MSMERIKSRKTCESIVIDTYFERHLSVKVKWLVDYTKFQHTLPYLSHVKKETH